MKLSPFVFLACLAAAGAAVATLTGQTAPKWRMQYFYDQDKSTFSIVDLQFPSARRGIAVGNIVEGSHERPTEVVTSDGGAHWEMIKLEESPLSLFFPFEEEEGEGREREHDAEEHAALTE